MLYLRPTNRASSLTLLNPRRGFFFTLNSITDLLESILAFNSSIIVPKAKNDISHSIQYNIKGSMQGSHPRTIPCLMKQISKKAYQLNLAIQGVRRRSN